MLIIFGTQKYPESDNLVVLLLATKQAHSFPLKSVSSSERSHTCYQRMTAEFYIT